MASFLAATVIVLASSVQDVMDLSVAEAPKGSLFRIMRWPAFFWYAWALLAPFVLQLSSRHEFTKRTWIQFTAIHVSGCALFFTVHVGLQVLAMFLPFYGHLHDGFRDMVVTHATWSVTANIFTYWVIVGIAHLISHYEEFRRREVLAARLETDLAQAQLNALSMQLQPHFLFNTLHAISTMMYRDLRGADRMLIRLSDLLRSLLRTDGAQEIPLREEMSYLEKYLEIEEIRFVDRLRVDIDVEPDVEDALVPRLILQPLVENAIKHGIAPHAAAGRVAVSAWTEGEELHLRVSDDGRGSPMNGDSSTPRAGRASTGHGITHTGVGLTNTEARLEKLYGNAYDMSVTRGDKKGWTVELTLPLRKLDPTEEGILDQDNRIELQS